jgi:hypothetical protein
VSLVEQIVSLVEQSVPVVEQQDAENSLTVSLEEQ